MTQTKTNAALLLFMGGMVGCFVGAPQSTRAGNPMTMRAGEWQTEVRMGGDKGQPARTFKTCYTADRTMTPALLSRQMGKMSVDCSRNDWKQSGNVVTSDLQCAVGGGQMTSHTVFTSYGDSMTAIGTSHLTGANFKMDDMHIETTGRRLGECQPGDRPDPLAQH